MDILFVCNDGGTMATVSLDELEAWAKEQVNAVGNPSRLPEELDAALSAILGQKAIAAEGIPFGENADG
ncbi:hypothetical protein XM25_00730 [Devosia sp. H5989]|nr:hypothetical protein XM25_00730 [Devosia sp. H5989]